MSKRKSRDSSEERHDKKKKSHKKHKKHKSKHHHGDAPEISQDDYFEKAQEFRVWLKLEKNIYFDDLSSTGAQSYFAKFVHKWNGQRLDSMYYTTIPQSILESIHRTKHKWGFKLNENERLELATTKDSVDVSTNKVKHVSNPVDDRNKVKEPARTSSKHKSSKEEDDDCDSDEERKRARRDRKNYNKRKEMVMEELVPKASGRDATIEKKRQVAAAVHGAARERDDAKDGLNLSDDFLLGGSDDFQARLQRRKQAQDRKLEEMQQRVAAAQDAEAARMQKFLADMGIQPGQDRITIAPRK